MAPVTQKLHISITAERNTIKPPPGKNLSFIQHREKFVENLKMVEDIVTAAEDNTLERKSQDYTGFKRFLFGSLEALDINVSDYIGQLFPLHPLRKKMYLKGH